MKAETMTEHLVALTHLPEEAFRDYLERATSLYQLLYAERPHPRGLPQELPAPANSAPSEKATPSVLPVPGAEPVATPTPGGVLPRPPMRPPSAGSLRESIYHVLEAEGAAASPKRIAHLVAAIRNVPLSDNLKANVGEILRNRHDPRIRRIANGLYAIEPRKLAA